MIEKFKIHNPVSIEENRHLSDRYGDAHYPSNKVRINTAKGDVVNTVIHELLHIEDFNKSEEKVLNQANRIERKMSLGEMGQLLIEASQSQKPKPLREWTLTNASKVVSQNIK